VLNNDYMHVSDALIYQKLKTYVYKYPFFTYKSDYSYNLDTSKQKPLHVYKKNVITNMYKKIFSHKNKTKNSIKKNNKTRKIK